MPSPAPTLEQTEALLKALRDPNLGKRSWDELVQLRALTQDPEHQKILAPPEHRAWAREYVRDNPAAAPVVGLMVPGYYLAKKTGAMSARTPADLDQVSAGWEGMAEGFAEALRGNK